LAKRDVLAAALRERVAALNAGIAAFNQGIEPAGCDVTRRISRSAGCAATITQ
jgi:hypothetical protein